MAEPRRIQLETVKPVPKEKRRRENPPTHRFTFALGESNDRTCPEFSYAELVKSARGEKKEPNPDDPYGEDEDDEKLRELARKFEEKYGPKVAKKKRKRMGKWEDYIDRGMGYDETDPFIDNDEAYDELVPSTLTTRHGGFYINSGELEFRRVSESDSDGTDETKPKKRRRRRLELSDKDAKRRRRIKDDDSVPKKRGRKPLDKSLSALNKAKQRKTQPTVATLLQQHKAQLQLQQDQEEQLLKQLQDSPLPAPIISSSDENELYMDIDQSQDLNLNKADFDNINNVIESVIKCSGDELLNNGQLLQAGNNVQAPASSDSEDMRVAVPIDSIDAPKLPENLPVDLNELITRIKQIALISEEGKCKFFSDDVNRMLLGVEIKTRELSCTQRSMIYSHLASYLPCTKETLLKRVKKLRIDQEGGKLREPMLKLRQAVTEVMPRMLEKYPQGIMKTEGTDGDGDAAYLSHGEENGVAIVRKFEWNDVVRELLCEVVRIKLKCYEVSKMRTQSAEEYLIQFLEADVKDLWPVGWMQGTILFKESRSAHAYLTTKPKKPLMVVKKLLPGFPSSSDLFPSAAEVVERNLSSTTVRALEAGGQPCPESFPTEFKEEEDLRDLTTSSSRLIIATSPVGSSADPSEKESPSAKPQQSDSTTERLKMESTSFLSSVYKNFEAPTEVPEKVSVSPSKKLFTNSEDMLQSQSTPKPTPQTSFAAQMLDKIICASLADFPNSGTSTAEPLSGTKLSTLDSVHPISLDSNKQHQLALANPLLRDDTVMKPPSSRSSDVLKGTQSYGAVASNAVSILKSNYSQPMPHQPQQRRQRASVLDHGSNSSSLLISNMASAVKQQQQSVPVSHVGPLSPVSSSNVIKNNSSTMPYQPYEFQEAFKRSLGIHGGGGVGSGNTSCEAPARVQQTPYVHPSARVQNVRTKKNHDDLAEKPVNFSAPNQTNSSHYASQELTRFASASVPVSGSYVNQQTPSSVQQQQQQRRTQHPVSESFPAGFMAEGMKGFPLPIKSGMQHGGSNMTTPPPAHSYPPAHRTPPNESGLTTSPHRHNSLSPHSPTHGLMSTSAGTSNHGSYPSTAPLSHYSPSPAEMPHSRSMIQTPWKVGSTSPTLGYSAPSQYSNASTSVTYTSNSSSQGGSQMQHGYSPTGSSSQSVHKRNIPSPAHQSSPTHQQPLNRNSMYNHSFTNTYSTSQSLLGQYPESNYTISNSHPLSPYHGPPITSLTGTGQQRPSQQRIP